MPVISSFYGIKIYFYYNEHNPPHFHAEYNGNKALIDIINGSVLKSALPKKQLKLVLAWAELHKDELFRNWELAKNNDELLRIEPLQ